MTIKTSRRWPGLILGLAGVLLTGCTMAGARGAIINTIGRPTGTGDCPPAAVTGTAPGLDPAQEANAKTVVGVALGRGLGPTGAAIAVAAALAESSLYNYANDGTSTLIGSAEGRQLNDAERSVARQSLAFPHDKVGNNLDSIGLFQQRPMTGWGTPAELINPATATGKFLDRMVTVSNWQTVSPWTVAQKVQGSPSSDGGIYRDTYQQATVIVAALDTGSTTAGANAIAQVAAADTSCGQPAANAATGPAAWGGYQNGRIPATALCPIPSKPALQLECGASTAFDQLNTAFKAQFGQDIGITDGYRSYDEQVQCRLAKGSLYANPGTSNHGWGKAVDIGGCCGINTGTGPAFDWLTANAGRYGWNHPAWAQAGGSKPEPWHWEYGAIS
ncbi:M15 family metallopeptidase [Nakamurella sp.]|uniref:M15 family metallopeptidase n=1 Tax=Nakamurella sp. TaxID=1869182 RepID=UPI003B3B6AE0